MKIKNDFAKEIQNKKVAVWTKVPATHFVINNLFYSIQFILFEYFLFYKK